MKNVTILILRHKNLGRGRSNPFLELMISWDLLFATSKPPLFEFALTVYSESVLKQSKHANVDISIFQPFFMIQSIKGNLNRKRRNLFE